MRPPLEKKLRGGAGIGPAIFAVSSGRSLGEIGIPGLRFQNGKHGRTGTGELCRLDFGLSEKPVFHLAEDGELFKNGPFEVIYHGAPDTGLLAVDKPVVVAGVRIVLISPGGGDFKGGFDQENRNRRVLFCVGDRGDDLSPAPAVARLFVEKERNVGPDPGGDYSELVLGEKERTFR